MGKEIKLNDPEWIDLIFENRNRDYGAYYLRRTSSRRHWWALLAAAVAAGILSVLLFGIYNKGKSADMQLEFISTTVELANITEMEQSQEISEVMAIQAELPPPSAPIDIAFRPPVIASDDEVTQENQLKPQLDLQQVDRPVMISLDDLDGGNRMGAMDITDIQEVKMELDRNLSIAMDNTVHDQADEMPVFPGGEPALLKFIYENITYPEDAVQRGVEGRVVLRFVIEKDGSIGEVRVWRSLDSSCDREAVRVIQLLPKWIPGKQGGVPVRVWFTQSIIFELL